MNKIKFELPIAMYEEDLRELSLKLGYCNTTLSELVVTFFNDLIDGKESGGSDERRLANEYFNRCGMSWINKNSFTKWLFDTEQAAIFDFSFSVNKKYEIKSPKNIEDINDFENAKEELDRLYSDYSNKSKEHEDRETAFTSARKFMLEQFDIWNINHK